MGFSTADKIVYGEQAHMHLHIIDPQHRRSGIGSACVRQTTDLYFATLALRLLFCEPNAFNVAPNRTLQSAGFRYVKTYMTVLVSSTFIRRSTVGAGRVRVARVAAPVAGHSSTSTVARR